MTTRQRQVLELLASQRWPEGAPLAELARVLKLVNESAVRFHVNGLIGLGYVERRQTAPRFKPAFITEAGRRALSIAPTPRVNPISTSPLETPIPVVPARCGPLTVRVEEPTYLEYLSDLFSNYRKGDLVLTAVGDSMICLEDPIKSIFDGDKCLIRPEAWPKTGEIAFVEFVRPNGIRECTLKEWHQDEDSEEVTLLAYNPDYAPIILKAGEIEVNGVVQDVVRSWRRAKSLLTAQKHAQEQAAREAKSTALASTRKLPIKKSRLAPPPGMNRALNGNGCSPLQPKPQRARRTKNATRAGLGNQSTGGANATHRGESTL